MTTQEPGESDNPFAPSRVLHQAALLEQADTWYRLQGRAVICRSTLRLPADCLATGVSGDLSATPLQLQLQTAGGLRAGRILILILTAIGSVTLLVATLPLLFGVIEDFSEGPERAGVGLDQHQSG